MKKPFTITAILGCTAVLLGAFGAHGLEGRVSERALEVWVTANRYHFLHTLAIFVLQSIQDQFIGTKRSLQLWLGGLAFFSGGLYTYALTGLKAGAMVAPIGGLLMAAGWLALLGVRRAS